MQPGDYIIPPRNVVLVVGPGTSGVPRGKSATSIEHAIAVSHEKWVYPTTIHGVVSDEVQPCRLHLSPLCSRKCVHLRGRHSVAACCETTIIKSLVVNHIIKPHRPLSGSKSCDGRVQNPTSFVVDVRTFLDFDATIPKAVIFLLITFWTRVSTWTVLAGDAVVGRASTAVGRCVILS